MSVYRIQTKDADGNWDTFGVGHDANWFESCEAAEAGWENLCETIPSYRDVEHQIVKLVADEYATKRLRALGRWEAE